MRNGFPRHYLKRSSAVATTFMENGHPVTMKTRTYAEQSESERAKLGPEPFVRRSRTATAPYPTPQPPPKPSERKWYDEHCYQGDYDERTSAADRSEKPGPVEQRVIVTGIDVPIGHLAWLLIELFIASIPLAFFLVLIWVFYQMVSG